MLAVYFALLGPRAAYAVTGALGRLLYRLLTPIQQQSQAQCRAALGDRVPPPEIPRLAEQAFVHRIWSLTDLLLAERWLHRGTYQRFGGQIPEPHLSDLLRAQARGQPAILLTAYWGPFDLLPILLGFNGIRAGVVYLPHANPDFDAYRRRIRARGGCELIAVPEGLGRLPEILEAGGTVAILADHHAERRGLPLTFLGLPTRVPRSVGLLACRYQPDVVVAGIRRVGCRFRFQFEVMDIIRPPDWNQQDDPVRYITERYLRALERLVLLDPTQYLWAYTRWGEDLARQLTASTPAG
jgi:lauroyl/myristoyl acyltransferase